MLKKTLNTTSQLSINSPVIAPTSTKTPLRHRPVRTEITLFNATSANKENNGVKSNNQSLLNSSQKSLNVAIEFSPPKSERSGKSKNFRVNIVASVKERVGSRDNSADTKSLAEFFKLKKKHLASKLQSEHKKFSTTENAFREIDKVELIKKRQEMMKYKGNVDSGDKQNSIDKLDLTINTNNAQDVTIVSPTPKERAFAQVSVLQVNEEVRGGKGSASTNASRTERRPREPSAEVLERLALGIKTKVKDC